MNNTVKNLKSLIKSTLKGDERLWFVNQDNEQEFNQTLLLDLVEKVDNTIISLLLQEEVLREKFFVKIVPPRPAKLSTPQEGNFSYVFKTNEFRFFMEENKVDNSYTSFKNRIGLTDGKKFLKDSGDIVLDWPYKDCVLEGGQSTEEGADIYFEYDTKSSSKEGNYIKKQGKRKEIFFNQVLAQDEIDRLLDPKALVNWKRFDKNGKTPLLSGGDEVDGVDALKRNEDGTIAENLIIKGNNLLALHSLKKQFRGKVKLIYIDPPFNTGNDSFNYNDNFSRSTWLTFMKNRLEIAKELLSNDGNIFIHIDINQTHYLKLLCDDIFGENNFVEELIWSYGSPSGGRAAGAKPVNIHDYILHYSKNYSGRKQNKTFIPYSDKYIKDWFKYEDEDGRKYQRRMRGKDENGNSLWIKQYLDDSKGVPLSTVWSDIKQVYADPRAYKDNQSQYTELEKGFTGGQKPEALLKRIFEMCTDEGDIVLDYHLGTGTTAVTAHKMKRQYIGIEQMQYIDDFSIKRLNNAIKGDEKGISKAVNWQGGGDFVYLELAKWNQQAKEIIQAAESLEEMIGFLDELSDKYFLNYNLKMQEFREKVILEPEFQTLSLESQKAIFMAMLDNNQMYVNKSEMADEKFGISEEEQKLTEEFYK